MSGKTLVNIRAREVLVGVPSDTKVNEKDIGTGTGLEQNPWPGNGSRGDVVRDLSRETMCSWYVGSHRSIGKQTQPERRAIIEINQRTITLEVELSSSTAFILSENRFRQW